MAADMGADPAMAELIERVRALDVDRKALDTVRQRLGNHPAHRVAGNPRQATGVPDRGQQPFAFRDGTDPHAEEVAHGADGLAIVVVGPSDAVVRVL